MQPGSQQAAHVLYLRTKGGELGSPTGPLSASPHVDLHDSHLLSVISCVVRVTGTKVFSCTESSLSVCNAITVTKVLAQSPVSGEP